MINIRLLYVVFFTGISCASEQSSHSSKYMEKIPNRLHVVQQRLQELSQELSVNSEDQAFETITLQSLSDYQNPSVREYQTKIIEAQYLLLKRKINNSDTLQVHTMWKDLEKIVGKIYEKKNKEAKLMLQFSATSNIQENQKSVIVPLAAIRVTKIYFYWQAYELEKKLLNLLKK